MSTSADDELCRDRMYQSRHVTNLPRTVVCPSGVRLSVEYARVGELPVCRRMILDAAKRGDNVGKDEFRDDEDFDVLLQVSEIFVCRKLTEGMAGEGNTGVGEPKAFILIQPCMYTRTWDTCWATIHIFYTADVDRSATDTDPTGQAAVAAAAGSVYGQLLTLAVEFVGQLDLGYTDCMICIASGQSRRLEAARGQGFVVIATIPYSVELAGVGLRDDFLLAKTLSTANRPRRPRDVIIALADRLFPADRVAAEYRELPEQPHKVDFLPQRYVFGDGLEVVVRTMYRDEDELVYAMMKDAADKGEGYGVDEFPTLSCFRAAVLADHPCFIFEEVGTGKMVGYMVICDSWYTRRSPGQVFESSVVISPQFQGRGVGKEVVVIELAMAAQLGYTASVNDWLGSNRRMATVVRQMFGTGVVFVGCIGRGAYTAKSGWDDQLLIWHDARGARTFTEIAERSRTTSRCLSDVVADARSKL